MAMKPRTGEAPAQAPLDQPLFVDDAPTEPILRAPNPLQESVRFVNTDLEKAVQERALKNMGEDGSLNIPDHVPRSLVENPDAGGAREVVPTDKKNPWVKRGIATVAGALAIGVGIGVVHNNAEKSAPENTSSGANGGDRTASAPVVPGETARDYSNVDPNTLTVDQFYNDSTYPQEYRIKWANEIIKQREQQAHAELSSILVEHGYPALGALVEPDVNNTGNEILVQHDVINYIATSDPNQTEGKKLLAASVSSDIAEHVFATWGEGPTVAFHKVPQDSSTNTYIESPAFSHTIVNNYAPNGVPSKIISYTNGITSEGSQSIEQFVGGRWITHHTMKPGDPNIVKYPEQVTDR